MRIGDEERAVARIRAVQAASGLAVTGLLDGPTWDVIVRMREASARGASEAP